jgi:CRP-like cAMP-binding protein
LDLLTFLSSSSSALDKESARVFASAWSVEHVEKGRRLAAQGEPEPMERIILDGRAISQISDAEGRAVCVGFHAGPCVVTPNVARTRNGTSLVSIDVIADALVAQMDSRALTELMLASVQIREWANGILQQELARKADREWCLSALGGADRLAWFRKGFPHHEDLFGHYLIASYLGVTPVTLSRLRGAERGTAIE